MMAWDLFMNSGTALVLDVVLKATVLLLLALVAAWLLRTSSAALRHRVWLLTFVCLALLPPLTLIVPAWQLPILPALNEPDVAAATEPAPQDSVPATTPLPNDNSALAQSPNQLGASGSLTGAFPDESAIFPDANEPLFPGNPGLDRPEFASSARPFAAAPSANSLVAAEAPNAAPSVAASPIQTPVSANLAAFWLVAWLCGALFCVAPLLRGLWQNRQSGRTSEPVREPCVLALLSELSQELGVRRHVRLLQTSEVPVPLTWGFLCPAILLPATWSTWSAFRLRLVLLHELAHVQRRDVAVQLVCRVLASLYWFHPLSWLALRRMRIESELACDDCVLLAGESPQSYASELIEIARAARRFALPAAMAMAQTTSLEQRVRAMLDRARNRLPLGRRFARGLLLVSLVIVLTTAAIRPVVRQAEARLAPDDPSSSVEANANNSPATDPAGNKAADPAITKSSKDENVEGNAAAKQSPEGVRHYSGTVTDPAGKPVAGARVRLMSNVEAYPVSEKWIHEFARAVNHRLHAETLLETTTNAQGEFTIEDRWQEREQQDAATGRVREIWRHMAIVVTAEGFSPGWAGESYTLDETKRYPISLSTEAPAEAISGKLIDLQGQPIADADVSVEYVAAALPGGVDTWLAGLPALMLRGFLPIPQNRGIGYPDDPDTAAARYPVAAVVSGEMLSLPEVRTDAGGRFEIRGLQQDQLAILRIHSAGHVDTFLNVVVRDMPMTEACNADRAIPNSYDRLPHEYYGKACTLVLLEDQRHTGTVRDADTEEPIPGVLIYAAGTEAKCLTDASGRFFLTGLAPGSRVALSCEPPPALPFRPCTQRLPHIATGEPVDIDIKLRKTVWVEGRVTNHRTGEPVAGIRMSHTPRVNNPLIDQYPELDREYPRTLNNEERYLTDKDGRYRVRAIPGEGVLVAVSYEHVFQIAPAAEQLRGVQTLEGHRALNLTLDIVPDNACIFDEIKIPAEVAMFRQDAEVDPGLSVTLRILDATASR